MWSLLLRLCWATAVVQSLRILEPSNMTDTEIGITMWALWARLPPPSPGIVANVVLADPLNACTALKNDPTELEGAIVLTFRGGCKFATKRDVVEATGAAAYMVAQIKPPYRVFTMWGSGGKGIPALMIRGPLGMAMKDAIEANQTLKVDMFQEAFAESDSVKTAMQQWYSDAGPWNADAGAYNQWEEDLHPCKWAGIHCLTDGHVVLVEMIEYGVKGPLPKFLEDLEHLDELQMGDNPELTGTVPSLPALRQLAISHTGITSIDEAFRSPDMHTILADSCNISGSLPPVAEWPVGLEKLVVSNNKISGTHPILSSLTSLQRVDLQFNQLSGAIPATAYDGLGQLSNVDISHNAFEGEIPASLVALPSLSKLILASNGFQAFQTGAKVGGTDLAQLDVSNNELDVFPDLNSTSLKSLDLSHNKLSTLLGANLRTLLTLETMDVSHNVIDDSFHDFMDTLPRSSPNLKTIKASHNLVGQGETEFGFDLGFFEYFGSMEHLDLSHNKLGLMSVCACAINLWSYSMRTLLLNDNGMSGRIRPELEYFVPSLEVLDLRNNNLSQPLDSTSPLPEFMTMDMGKAETDLAVGHVCPHVYVPEKPVLQVLIDHSYYQWVGCRCRDGYFRTSEETGSYPLNKTYQAISCEPCLEHATCHGFKGSVTGSTVDKINPLPGYYPSPPAPALPKRMLPCRFQKVDVHVADNPCQLEALSVDQGTGATFTCAEGHKGRMCAACEEGFYSFGGFCKQCTSTHGTVVAVVCTLGVILGTALLAWKARTKKNRQSNRSADKSNMSVVDHVSLHAVMLLGFSQVYHATTSQLQAVDDIFGTIALLDGTDFAMGGTNSGVFCPFGSPGDFATDFRNAMIAPVIILAVVFSMQLVASFVTKNMSEVKVAMAEIGLKVGAILHLPVTMMIVPTLLCDTDPESGKRYLIARPAEACESIGIGEVAVAALVYSIGFPVLCFFRARYETKNPNSFLDLTLYTKDVFFSTSQLLYKLGLSIVMSLTTSTSLFQPVLLVTVFVAWLVYLAAATPYWHKHYNRLASLLTMLLAILYTTRLGYSATALIPEHRQSAGLLTSLLLLAVLLYMVGSCAWMYIRRGRGATQKVVPSESVRDLEFGNQKVHAVPSSGEIYRTQEPASELPLVVAD